MKFETDSIYLCNRLHYEVKDYHTRYREIIKYISVNSVQGIERQSANQQDNQTAGKGICSK